MQTDRESRLTTGLASIPPAAAGILPPRDPAMKLVEESALQVAASDETVLLLGETGVGKDVLARRIHAASPRVSGKFVSINCAALPEGLLESELFGRVRGAYTGAVDSQPGQFEVADGGTIFLDEIGELSPRLQAKLLHVLQEKMFCRVGGRSPIRANVRVVAATNQDLDLAMTEGSFRRDLYYRLSVVCLRIPPLRERPGDVEALARFFALKYATLYNRPALAEPDPASLAAMRGHSFEGNVRELENLVKRAILLGSYGKIVEEIGRVRTGAAEAPSPMVQETAFFAPEPEHPTPLKEVARKAVEEAERGAILNALTATKWNRRRAADLLKVSYRSLLYKIRDYAIVPRGEPFGSNGDLISARVPIVSSREGSC